MQLIAEAVHSGTPFDLINMFFMLANSIKHCFCHPESHNSASVSPALELEIAASASATADRLVVAIPIEQSTVRDIDTAELDTSLELEMHSNFARDYHTGDTEVEPVFGDALYLAWNSRWFTGGFVVVMLITVLQI